MSKIKRELRKGFTTGACAQAAAKASSLMLIKGHAIDSINVKLPNGDVHSFDLIGQGYGKDFARCCVIKDASGDNRDVTGGIKICAEVRREAGSRVRLIGGKGVGTVTVPGLAVGPGEAAINPVPKSMILRDAGSILPKGKGFCIEISVPMGEELADKTYNPRLGIEGGISIIGRRGTVIPKSIEAYKATISLALNVARKRGNSSICLAAGSISEGALKERFGVVEENIVTIGDHAGFALDECEIRGIRNVVYIGHIGKVAKVAAGIFNTHSSYGDARLETIAAYAAAKGASQKLVSKILSLKLAEASIKLLRDKGLISVFDSISKGAAKRLKSLTKGNNIDVGAVALGLSGEIIGANPIRMREKKEWQKFQ